MSKCEDCDGKGFKEYDAGLLSIGCKTCEMTGKIDEALTKEEFESVYAFRNDMTVDQVREIGLEAVPSGECVQGWAMQQIVVAEPEPEPEMPVIELEPELEPGPYSDTAEPEVKALDTEASVLPDIIVDETTETVWGRGIKADDKVLGLGTPTGHLVYEIVPTPATTLKKGQYWCGKCKKAHTEKSKIGKKHLKYKTEVRNESDTGGNRPTGGDTGSDNPGKSSEPERSEDETGTGADSSYLLQED